MVSVDVKSLVSKLNETTHRALEAAAGFCLSRPHYNVETRSVLGRETVFGCAGLTRTHSPPVG